MLRHNHNKSLQSVPITLVICFVLSLFVQSGLHYYSDKNSTEAIKLDAPPDANVLKLMSFGEPQVLAKLMMLWLQSFDNQPGNSIPFNRLNYHSLEQWLNQIIMLDPKSSYPMLAASRIYTEVPDIEKQKIMMELVYQQFLLRPEQNWPWLAHVTVITKHQLKDYGLALKYAHVLADNIYANQVPYWARRLELLLLEDIGERESLEFVVGGLIKSQSIKDKKELLWLEKKLQQLKGSQ